MKPGVGATAGPPGRADAPLVVMREPFADV